jgi:hypothetical protein
MRLLLILLLIPIPLPILLPIPTKAYSKVSKNMMLERSYGKEFNGLGVKPFASLTPDASLGRFNHSTYQTTSPWWGSNLARGKGHYLNNRYFTVTL